jgi:hypothetical protein
MNSKYIEFEAFQKPAYFKFLKSVVLNNILFFVAVNEHNALSVSTYNIDTATSELNYQHECKIS